MKEFQMKTPGNTGAGDGARTRDLRRDRPEIGEQSQARVTNPEAATGGNSAEFVTNGRVPSPTSHPEKAPFPDGSFTPGPWGWFGNAKTNSIYLATVHGGRRYVMDFTRWGMRGAQPRFQLKRGGMVDAQDLLQFEVGNRSVVGVQQARADDSVYRLDIRGIDCPDARLMMASPDLFEALRVARDAVLESFEHVKDRDDQLLADARLTQIDAALSKATGGQHV